MGTPNIAVPPGQDSTSPSPSFSLKLRGGETGGSIMMFEKIVPAGTKSTFHLHRDSDEVAYVLSGEVTFLIGDDVTLVSLQEATILSLSHISSRHSGESRNPSRRRLVGGSMDPGFRRGDARRVGHCTIGSAKPAFRRARAAREGSSTSGIPG